MRIKIKLIPTIIIVAACFALGYAAGMLLAPKGAKISGTVADAADSEVILKLLNVNRYEILDTVATDAAGKFSYKLDVEKGQPEFVYVFHNDTKIASLLLDRGDKVEVKADTLGHYTVTGSEESNKLAVVEKNYAEALVKMDAIAAKIETSDEVDASLSRELSKIYVDYYRDCVKYIIQNSKSLTAVPVLYQNFGAELPVFAQTTDAIHFVNTADSLETVYPDSKYVKALRKEAERRFGYLEMETKLMDAEEIGFFDVELPDIKANMVKLSEVDAKVIMLYFWTPSDASQSMFNLEVLKSLYEDYHERGFEIYQAAIDPDKALWAQVVKKQNLPWINVCDGLGANSPYVSIYNLAALPATYIIADGGLVDGQIVDEKSLRKLLDQLLSNR